MDESQFRALIRDHVQKIELRRPASVLRANLESKENELATRKGGIERLLQDARNSDLAEMIQEREVKQLLRMYHIEKKRFLPVGAIKEDVESLDRIVSSPRGPILRALLYGPPGTGKTEVLREIGARHGQKVRVISLHETSTFETLVGTQQIPLPKAETLQDAETFWKTISEASSEEAAAHVPAGILEEFSGATPEEKLQDFKGWFEAKLKTARVAAAIGAVSPDDPRVKKAYQEALAAWLDQPLTEGLMNGDLVILDEADRAGNALEGLQDVLTRRPGDMYQPPGRPKSFRIHPEARVAMTANWGDLQTEATAGGGRFSSAIVSRVVEKRKVGYLDSDTEQKLFEIMVTPPESPHRSLLAQDERDAAYALISKVFPKLRDLYLKPGELQFVTPVSVRTLENIARRLVDDTTRTRVKDKSGNPVHFIEAAWQEIASGPFREDQRERILEQLAMIFAEKGIFHNLGNAGGSEPWYLQAARITGIDASRVKVFMGMTVEEEQVAAAAGGIFELPKDFSLGKKIANANRAKNMALFEPLQFTSARGIKLEAERERRRLIEEYGGNYETQERLQSVLRNWSAFDAGLPQEIRDDPEKRLSADVDFLTEQIVGLDVSSGDIQLFVEQLERSRTGSPDLWKRGGLLLSLVVNRFFEFMPEDQWSAVSIELDLKKTPKLDYVGFRLPGGALNIDGELGDYAGRELAGGTLAGFTAGSKTAYGMTKGHVVFESIGDRGGQKMKGGQMEITVLAGERLGMDMEGGKITASTAGARAGFRARGKLIIETAGERLGEELKHGGTIEVESYTSLSNNIRGTIRKKDGTVLVERGSRKGV
ncbi:MAG: AAA family ATPase [bacterium]|nr:AAA family ATPase [bacterium]